MNNYIFITINILSIFFCAYYYSNIRDCLRNYPTENLSRKVEKRCIYNPFLYSYNWKDISEHLNLDGILKSLNGKGKLIFYTVVDDNSFKYILNLYRVFLIPYNIKSLITIVFYKNTLRRCERYKIFCIYNKWPYFLNNITKINTRKILWFLKFYYFYYIIKKKISLLFIDSDVLFINNCLENILNRKEDIILLKSQLNKNISYGNSGLM